MSKPNLAPKQLNGIGQNQVVKNGHHYIQLVAVVVIATGVAIAFVLWIITFVVIARVVIAIALVVIGSGPGTAIITATIIIAVIAIPVGSRPGTAIITTAVVLATHWVMPIPRIRRPIGGDVKNLAGVDVVRIV